MDVLESRYEKFKTYLALAEPNLNYKILDQFVPHMQQDLIALPLSLQFRMLDFLDHCKTDEQIQYIIHALEIIQSIVPVPVVCQPLYENDPEGLTQAIILLTRVSKIYNLSIVNFLKGQTDNPAQALRILREWFIQVPAEDWNPASKSPVAFQCFEDTLCELHQADLLSADEVVKLASDQLAEIFKTCPIKTHYEMGRKFIMRLPKSAVGEILANALLELSPFEPTSKQYNEWIYYLMIWGTDNEYGCAESVQTYLQTKRLPARTRKQSLKFLDAFGPHWREADPIYADIAYRACMLWIKPYIKNNTLPEYQMELSDIVTALVVFAMRGFAQAQQDLWKIMPLLRDFVKNDPQHKSIVTDPLGLIQDYADHCPADFLQKTMPMVAEVG